MKLDDNTKTIKERSSSGALRPKRNDLGDPWSQLNVVRTEGSNPQHPHRPRILRNIQSFTKTNLRSILLCKAKSEKFSVSKS